MVDFLPIWQTPGSDHSDIGQIELAMQIVSVTTAYCSTELQRTAPLVVLRSNAFQNSQIQLSSKQQLTAGIGSCKTPS
jgi:hypothetical protein